MLKVRISNASSGSTAVQVVFYTTHKVNVVKHIGSGKTDQEIEDLKTLGCQYIEQHILEPGQTFF